MRLEAGTRLAIVISQREVVMTIEQELDLFLKEIKEILMDHLNDLTPAEQGEANLPELLKATIEVYQDVKGGIETKDQIDANAHLIAAAPEMYEAIEKTLLALDGLIKIDTKNELKEARILMIKALAKARGEND